MFRKTLISSAIGLLGAPMLVLAAPVTYIGSDNAVSSLAQMTNSAAAAASFDAAVPGATVIDFESPLPAGVSISGGSTTSNSGCGALCGFNTTSGGSLFRSLSGGSVTFTFASPVNAFGMYITGLQTNAVVQQTLTYTDGSTDTIINAPTSTGGGGAFMGFVDSAKLVTSVTFDATQDIVAIDDVRFGGGAATDALAFNPAGVGHILYVPYFSTQEGNVTAINIVNTDTVNGKVLKIRFRGASNSDDLYDFQVFLSPGDVWTAGITKGADGRSQLSTTDKSCTLPSNVNGSFITGRISSEGGVNETREGYIEILTMADIVKGADKSNQLALYTATKHVKTTAGYVAPCTASVLTALTRENSSSYMVAPTTGLMANWTIINVQAGNYYAYSGPATAIEARDADSLPIAGNLVYWDQRSTPLTQDEILAGTADPLIRDGAIVGARYDLPDLSTPYLPGSSCPFCQARALSDAITVQEVAGEFYSEPTLGAQTDWVISFPTRRYFAAVDYADDDTPVYSEEGNIYFNEDNTEMGSAANGGKAWQLCSVFGTNALAFYTREEEKSIVDDIVISPGTPSSLSICGEVTVLGINVGASTATFGSVARANVSNGFKEGWGSLATPTSSGLPMLVRQFTRVSNTQTNLYYGLSYPARTIVPGNPEPFVPGN